MDYNTFKPVIVTLSNGLRVANFSSNHEFKFVDGTILPAVSDELCKALSMNTEEHIFNYSSDNMYSFAVHTIKLIFMPSKDVTDAINYWQDEFLVLDTVDIVIVPLPVITMMRQSMNWNDDMLYNSPFRTIRVADRLTKLICIDKFCI